MERLGFHDHKKWVSLVMDCITTLSYSILLNGSPKGYNILSRGLS
jgi:hypothetical protein